jgi:hypothetical protein
MTMDYEKQARAEAFAATEAAIQARAADMERADAEKARLAKLAAEYGLPADASPRQIADAERDREAKHRAAVRAKYGNWVDPNDYVVGSVG